MRTYEPFLQLALVAHHDLPEVRQAFIDQLVESLSFCKLPFSYCSILALCATLNDPAEVKKIQNLLKIGRAHV